jgi:hypothetical protein
MAMRYVIIALIGVFVGWALTWMLMKARGR